VSPAGTLVVIPVAVFSGSGELAAKGTVVAAQGKRKGWSVASNINFGGSPDVGR
jgi:hypothetical protein